MRPAIYCFGSFELNISRFELRRKGRVVRLERIPMDLLALLAERNGEVVTRPEIVERLWGKKIFVDTEHGINTAVRKIRTALGEDAERPRFVHTIPGKGYRLAVDRAEHEQAVLPAADPPIDDADPAANPDIDPAPAGEPIALPKTPRRWRSVAVAAAAVILLAGAFVIGSQSLHRRALASGPASIHSIAVLPLVNLSSDRSQEYFADGMTDELLTMLAKRTSLHVISRTSTMRYKNVSKPLRDIAYDLGADVVLEGSVTKSDAGVHVTLQLIDASTDTHLWADSFDRDPGGASALSSSVADRIAHVVGAGTTHAADRQVSSEAHQAYLHGRYFWFADDYDRSQAYLERAIQAQPDYPQPWSGLADVYVVRAVAGLARPDDVIPRARAANQKALDLDAALPEAHNGLAAIHLFYDWGFHSADAEAQRAIELNPSFAEPHHLRSYILIALGRGAEALQEQKRATELDPFARPWALGFVLVHLRQYEAAIDELRLNKAAQPGDRFTSAILAECYRYKHMDRESALELAASRRLIGDEQGAIDLTRAFDSRGMRGIAEYQLQVVETQSRKSYVSPLALARAHARLRHREQTLTQLEAAVRERSPFLIFLQNEPDFDFLHGDPRYQALVHRIGLPRY
jgi:TolB-like protein/DNA-binding winged helix-turn-helix (wHTH) protein